ncbi:MAG: hypothetical protein WC638_02475 [Candidatus Paceibacterota bacterium]|jgi:hypothetical protein
MFLPFSSARAGTAYVSFDPSIDETNGIAGYRVYVGLTYASVANQTVTPINIGSRHSYCINAPDNVPGFFVAVSTLDNRGMESVSSNVVYILYGNIKEDAWDGTSYNAARVDGQDLAIIGQYWGQTVTQQNINCNAEFVIEVPTLKQKADLYPDGHIDGRDQSIVGQRWGKILPP